MDYVAFVFLVLLSLAAGETVRVRTVHLEPVQHEDLRVDWDQVIPQQDLRPLLAPPLHFNISVLSLQKPLDSQQTICDGIPISL